MVNKGQRAILKKALERFRQKRAKRKINKKNSKEELEMAEKIIRRHFGPDDRGAPSPRDLLRGGDYEREGREGGLQGLYDKRKKSLGRIQELVRGTGYRKSK